MNNRKIQLAVALSMVYTNVLMAKVVTYTPHSSVEASEWYTASVDGNPCFVYHSSVAPFTLFDLEGETWLEIKSKKYISHVDIRPASLGLVYSHTGYTLRIKVHKPCQFSVELNKNPSKEPLLVFVNPVEKSKPAPNDTNVIFFEGGKVHKAGKIKVPSNKTLYIEGGAVVQGYISTENTSNVRILGRGILDGIDNKIYMNNPDYDLTQGKEKFIDIRFAKFVTISGLTLVNPVGWQVVPRGAQNIWIDNIHLVSDYPSDDGIDIVSSQDVTIINSFLRTKDDNIVVKCIYNKNTKQTTKNVLVENCVLWNAIWGNNLEIGFELPSDTVSDIMFRNIDVIHCEGGAVFSIHNTDFAVVTRVLLENIRVEDARQKLFDLSIFLSKYSKDNIFHGDDFIPHRYWHGVWDNAVLLSEDEKKQFSGKRGHISNIKLSNIRVTGGQDTFSILYGYDAKHKVTNVEFDRIYIRGKKITKPEDMLLKMEFAESVRFK